MGATSVSTTGNVAAARFLASSDRRLKKDIESMTTSLESLQLLRPVTFKWIQTDEVDSGVIAQECAEVAPECVHTDISGHLRVDYARLVPYLLQWLHLLTHEVKALQR